MGETGTQTRVEVLGLERAETSNADPFKTKIAHLASMSSLGQGT